MRWKLLVITSLLAAIAGAGLCAALTYFLLASSLRPATADWLSAMTLLLPLASITYASIFVYRHTARRRRLQAALTALLSLLLTAGALFATATYSSRLLSFPPEQSHGERQVSRVSPRPLHARG